MSLFMQETCYNNPPFVSPLSFSEETLVEHRLPLDWVWNSLNNQWRNKTTLQYPGLSIRSKSPQLIRWIDKSLVTLDRLQGLIVSHKVPLWSPQPPRVLCWHLKVSRVVPLQETCFWPSIHSHQSIMTSWTWMRKWEQSLSLGLFSLDWICFDSFCNLADCKKLWKATPTSWVHLYSYSRHIYAKYNNPNYPNRKWYHRYTKRTRQGIIDMHGRNGITYIQREIGKVS